MKVYPFKIPKKEDERIIVQVDKEPIFYNRLHQHEEIQISHIIHGSGKLLVGDSIHQFVKGETYVIGGNLPHLFRSIPDKKDGHMVSLFFTEETFGKDFFTIPDLKEVLTFFNQAKNGFKVIEQQQKVVKYLMLVASSENVQKFISFLKLLDILTTVEKKSLTKFISPKSLTLNEGERLQVIFDYIFKNFHKPIQLSEIADMAFMTPTAFCRFFKQRTNKTFFQFLIELRVEHACQLLGTDQEYKINEVSYLCGFNSISNFNRKFKSIKGQTPSTYKTELV